MKDKILKEFDEMSEMNEFYGLPYNDLVDSSIKQFISDIIDQTREETIKEIIRSVEENQKGQFEDDGGYICWYLDNLVDLLNKILNKLKK